MSSVVRPWVAERLDAAVRYYLVAYPVPVAADDKLRPIAAKIKGALDSARGLGRKL